MRNHVTRLLTLLSIGAIACAPGLASPQTAGQTEDNPILHVTQVDRSQFPTIQVYLSVTDASGEPVPVEANRLQLFEEGALIQPEAISGQGEIGPLTTLLVIDVSGSMAVDGKLEAAKSAAGAYVEQMRPGDQAGVLAFAVQNDLVQPVTQNRQALLESIDSLVTQDDTAMYDALARGIQLLEPIEGRKAIIALTDGMDNSSKDSLDTVLDRIGEGGLSISAIGLGDTNQLGVSFAGLDEGALRELSGRAGGIYGVTADRQALRDLYQRLGRALQSEYRITYTSDLLLRDGVNRTLTVQLQDSAAVGEAVYNPGGVLPEVAASASWALFAGLLAGLVALLLLPGTVRRGASLVRRPAPASTAKAPRGSRIRLRDEAAHPPQRKVKLR